MNEKIMELIGPLPEDRGELFKQRMRVHQCWWRTFVLMEEPGQHPQNVNKTVCNTIKDGHISHRNFLTEDVILAVSSTLQEREIGAPGIIQESRLFGNLLSSQPLCFNFFGVLKSNRNIASKIMQSFFPTVTEVKNVFFEYGPEERYLNDNSAFDVAFEVVSTEGKGLIGFECKYTDDFSYQNTDTHIYYGDNGCPNRDAYLAVYEGSPYRFKRNYEDYVQNKQFNQLFRNQLIAEALVQNKKFDFVTTGLFCHHDDNEALASGTGFQNMLLDGEKVFQVITYKDFIETVQRLDIDWNTRIWTMLLWTRYCAMELSDSTYELLSKT